MLLLNAGHLLGNVSLDESGIVPFEFAAAAGGHILGCVVEFVRDLLVGRGFGPVRGAYVVGLATQEQGVHSRNVSGDEAERLLVEQRCLPAAVLEASLGVFFRSAGRLHDAVQGYHFADDELAHDVPARLEAIPMKRVCRPRLSDVVAPDKLATAPSITYNLRYGISSVAD